VSDTAIALACEGIAKALNRALEYDPQTPQKLGALAGKSLLIESTAPRFTASILFTDSQIIIMPSDECLAPAMLSGTAPALIRFLMAADVDAAEECEVELHDENALITTLLTFSRETDIDWEALLAEHTGDVAAHLFGESIRKAQQFQQDIVSRGKNGWATYKTDNSNDNDADDRSDDSDDSDDSRPQSPLDFIGAQLKVLLP